MACEARIHNTCNGCTDSYRMSPRGMSPYWYTQNGDRYRTPENFVKLKFYKKNISFFNYILSVLLFIHTKQKTYITNKDFNTLDKNILNT